ncbi:3D domain-containing protein [Halobacillus litoralis]|uniref:3D domain-containing protein n=1 Tax=Halobacillus litoralis TaxID=45668 RepID=UPI001CD53C1A|nr:3D domain-containing protein [Halobacillus litoralis]MCA1021516.1 3D domain-containing protein [Halobacillus litoralis]
MKNKIKSAFYPIILIVLSLIGSELLANAGSVVHAADLQTTNYTTTGYYLTQKNKKTNVNLNKSSKSIEELKEAMHNNYIRDKYNVQYKPHNPFNRRKSTETLTRITFLDKQSSVAPANAKPDRTDEPKKMVAVSNSERYTENANEVKHNKTKQANTSTKKKKEVSSNNYAQKEDKSSDKWETYEVTAYTAYCDGCSGITYTGVNLKENPNARVIAVDPSVIPLGSKVEIEGYGTFKAEDIGGAIKGNRIDMFIQSKDEALKFGRRELKVKIVE